MSFYTHNADKKSGDGLALTDWNNLSSAIAGNQGLTLALNQNDKVGIGTRNPTAKLEVSGGAIRPAAGNNENSGILFPKNPGGGTWDAAWLRYYARAGEATTLELGISNDASDHIALMPNRGNVGIGTTSPGEKLEVKGKVKATHFIGNGSQLTNLTVGLNGLNLATSSGNVGIGTTSPAQKLEVAGNVKITGVDLMLDSHTRRDGQAGNHRRALVHGPGDKLLINYAGDYTGGVQIHGRVAMLGGHVGLNTESPEAPLSIAGDGKESSPNSNMHITNDCILFGGNNNGKGTHSAQISAGKHVGNSLNIVGMSSNTSHLTRKIDCWAEAGFTIRGRDNVFTITTDNKNVFFHIPRSNHGNNRRIRWDGDTNWDWASDRNAKTDIESEQDILRRLVQLDVKNFRWKDSPESTRKTIGLIAQDVQPLFPSLVGEMPESDGQEKHLTLKLGAFGVLAVGAIKELKVEIDALKAKIAQLSPKQA